jgi:hypothetical protein
MLARKPRVSWQFATRRKNWAQGRVCKSVRYTPMSLACDYYIIRRALIAAIAQARAVFGPRQYCGPGRSRMSAASSKVQARVRRCGRQIDLDQCAATTCVHHARPSSGRAGDASNDDSVTSRNGAA